MKRLKKFGPRYGYKKFAEGGNVKKYKMGGRPMRGMDVDADIKALETLQQGDYDVGGPKQRFARGKVKRMAGGGSVGSASKRADGCAVKGKTKGRMI